MALNQELLSLIQKAESDYGHTDYWPEDVLAKARVLANREPEATADRKETEWLYRRGFTGKSIAHRMRRSAGWAAARKPVITEFIWTDEDLIELSRYSKLSLHEVEQKMSRNGLWVREMRRMLDERG